MPVDIRIANRAARLRALHRLRTADALHVATALEMGCDTLLTNDARLKSITDIRILTLDDLELDLSSPNDINDR